MAWVFDGCGVAIPVALISWLAARRSGSGEGVIRVRQSQKSGAGSINLQSGRDITVSTEALNKTDSI